MHYIHVRYINNGKTWVPHIIRHTIRYIHTCIWTWALCVYKFRECNEIGYYWGAILNLSQFSCLPVLSMSVN